MFIIMMKLKDLNKWVKFQKILKQIIKSMMNKVDLKLILVKMKKKKNKKLSINQKNQIFKTFYLIVNLMRMKMMKKKKFKKKIKNQMIKLKIKKLKKL